MSDENTQLQKPRRDQVRWYLTDKAWAHYRKKPDSHHVILDLERDINGGRQLSEVK